MTDIRKIIIIFVIAVLFSVLVFAVIEALYPQPKYEDYCKDYRYINEKQYISQVVCPNIEISQAERDACAEKDGVIEFIEYDSNNCPQGYRCNTCQKEYELVMQSHSRYVFYISAFLALIAIFIGLYLPAEKNTLNEWTGTGFMLGGTFALFFGTLTSFMFLDRIVRPIVIFSELVLIIFISYKQIGNLREDKKKKK